MANRFLGLCLTSSVACLQAWGAGQTLLSVGPTAKEFKALRPIRAQATDAKNATWAFVRGSDGMTIYLDVAQLGSPAEAMKAATQATFPPSGRMVEKSFSERRIGDHVWRSSPGKSGKRTGAASLVIVSSNCLLEIRAMKPYDTDSDGSAIARELSADDLHLIEDMAISTVTKLRKADAVKQTTTPSSRH